MERARRCSDVGRATSWYYATYKGENPTLKGIFLTTGLPWSFTLETNVP